MFCFQAEDGIRDLVRSRGLGDVYKRQEYAQRVPNDNGFFQRFVLDSYPISQVCFGESLNAVSYTHLTLPTSDLV